MNEIELKTLDWKIDQQTKMIELHNDQPDDIKANDPMWYIVYTYHVAYLHGLRWTKDSLIQRVHDQIKEQPSGENTI